MGVRYVARRLGLTAAIAALIAGCGSETPSPPPRPVEKVDPPARLAAGWRTEINRIAGFTVGVPPAWRTKATGTATLLDSPDRQVAVTISADRTDEALDLPLDRFALETASGLTGFKGLVVGRPRPFRDRYRGVFVLARGSQATKGLPQRLQIVVLRRDRVAVYPILAASRVGLRSPFAQQLEPIIRSLRGRPVS